MYICVYIYVCMYIIRMKSSLSTYFIHLHCDISFYWKKKGLLSFPRYPTRMLLTLRLRDCVAHVNGILQAYHGGWGTQLI